MRKRCGNVVPKYAPSMSVVREGPRVKGNKACANAGSSTKASRGMHLDTTSRAANMEVRHGGSGVRVGRQEKYSIKGSRAPSTQAD